MHSNEEDSALNLSRILREQLLAAQPRPDAAPPSISPRRKQALHSWLDRLQNLTPSFLRAAVRPLYLNLFYRRFYPEYTSVPEPAPPLLTGRLMAWSGYAPFLEYKQQVCRTLHLDLRAFGCACTPGLVSVVLPVYNGARYLAASIESVLRQTYRDFELIVVDDGSTDASAEIAARYSADPRVRLIGQQNRKLPAALNAGFAQAGGEFFTWTSADNLMKPDMLEELVKFLRGNSDAEMVYADEELIDEWGAPALRTDFCRIYQRNGTNALARPFDPGPLNFVQNNYVGGCFLYRAWAGHAVGEYSEEAFGFEDYEYWMRMNALFRMAHLGRRTILYSYRLHSDSLTAREKELRIAERARYYLPREEERRRFFASSFDILLAGEHPWFPPLASAWRQAGHNVFEMPEETPEARYHYRVTRAFPKSMAVSAGEAVPGLFATLRGNCLHAADRDWIADGPRSLEYPLLALANSALGKQSRIA